MAEARAAQPDELPAVARALAAAFDDDPVITYILRDGAKRPRQAATFFQTELRLALEKGAALTTEGTTGGAIWMGPGKWAIGGLQLLRLWPVLLSWRSAVPRSLSLLSRMEKVHPSEPHWYLAVLGTHPDHQGKGVGSALLQPILDRCDAEGLPAYLESSKASNVPFYARHGFEVTGEVTVPGGPVVWPMWRVPR